MLVTGFDVVMRYILARPLDWSLAVSMVGLVALVFLTVPDLEARGEHIDMDLFYRRFGPRQQAVADFVSFLATFVFCAVSGIAAAVTAWHFLTANLRTSGTFNLPIWIEYAVVAIGLLLAALMSLLRYLLRRMLPAEPSPMTPPSVQASEAEARAGSSAFDGSSASAGTGAPAGSSAASTPAENAAPRPHGTEGGTADA